MQSRIQKQAKLSGNKQLGHVLMKECDEKSKEERVKYEEQCKNDRIGVR